LKTARRDKEHWQELYVWPHLGKTLQKLMELVTEITRLLDEKQQRLRSKPLHKEESA